MVYAVLGSGMQGTAVGYDLAKFGDAHKIFMGDLSMKQAKASADRVNQLVHSNICIPKKVDALDPVSLTNFLDSVNVLASCVPYWMHPKVAQAAIITKTNMVDMGGCIVTTEEILALDKRAKSAGVTVVPDTGLAPGLVNSIALYFLEKLDKVDSIKIYCGGVPQFPTPEFQYNLSYNIEGLTAEYSGEATIIQDGKICKINTLEEIETIQHDELGTLEAFTTSGSTGTAPYTWETKVHNFQYKTLRYPGHCRLMKVFKDSGFWLNDAIDIEGAKVKPREVFHSLMKKSLVMDDKRDIVLVIGVGEGMINGREFPLELELLDKYDETTQFTAMERTAGFSTSIHAINLAKGNLAPGCIKYENAMTSNHFLRELVRRDIHIKGFH